MTSCTVPPMPASFRRQPRPIRVSRSDSQEGSMPAVSENHRHAPVLIVGGGPAGLTMSMLLSTLGVNSLLVERRTGESGVPKAHIISPRSMEILSQCGIAERVLSVSSPHEYMSQTVWMTSLAGPTDLHGRELARS